MARFHLHMGGRREFVGKSLGFDLLLGGEDLLGFHLHVVGRVRLFNL